MERPQQPINGNQNQVSIIQYHELNSQSNMGGMPQQYVPNPAHNRAPPVFYPQFQYQPQYYPQVYNQNLFMPGYGYR